VVATDTAVIGGTTLTATQLRASDTLTVALGNAGDTFVLNGSTFTAVSGAAGAQQYDVSSGVNATIAASIANAINTSVDPKVVGVVEAKSAAAIVTVYAKAIGTWANTIPLTSTGCDRHPPQRRGGGEQPVRRDRHEQRDGGGAGARGQRVHVGEREAGRGDGVHERGHAHR
jgi:hypothetical protein